MKALKLLAYCFDGFTPKTFNPGDPVTVGKDVREIHVAGLEAAGYLGPDEAAVSSLTLRAGADELLPNGPTVAEFVAAGYLAANYPPGGYASKSSAEEIAAAIEAQRAAAEEKAKKDAASGTPKVDDHKFASVEIIEAWAHLDWPALKSLASSVSDDPIVNKVEATAAIEAELKRRAAWAEANPAPAAKTE